MNFDTFPIRSGYDGKKCLVHARCCYVKDDFMIATAQYLDVTGCDLFDGIKMSQSFDGGKTWSAFVDQKGLEPIIEDDIITVGCDGTPMLHKKSQKVIVLGHTAQYSKDGKLAENRVRSTFYSVFNCEKNEFSKIKFIKMPENITDSGNGCGQSIELKNGDLLIPFYYKKENSNKTSVAVMRCSFDGETVTFKEMGNTLDLAIARGIGEPSIVFHKDTYYLTLRNDECGLVAKSKDGLHFTDMQLWKWEDGSILQNYNTQQHWMVLEDELYLVYTRRGADNDRVFRHRAPLFAAKVNDEMRLIKETEMALIPERGARLGNFGVTEYKDGKSVVMAAEWMQPIGCEKNGSDNTIWVSIVEK